MTTKHIRKREAKTGILIMFQYHEICRLKVLLICKVKPSKGKYIFDEVEGTF